MMKIFIRVVALAMLAALVVLRVWIGVLGLAEFVGVDWAIALALALLLCGFVLPLRIAVVYGAVTLWHWPLVLAVRSTSGVESLAESRSTRPFTSTVPARLPSGMRSAPLSGPNDRAT